MELQNITENLYSFIWKPLLKPKRENYKIDFLYKKNYRIIPIVFKNYFKEEIQAYIFLNKNFNINLLNFSKNLKNYNSIYINKNSTNYNIIIYLHSHSSNSLECLNIIQNNLSKDTIIISFDFRCHGKSGGEFCSFGFFETLDIDALLENLKFIFFKIKCKYVLWGRSMGSVTSIFYLSENFQKLIWDKYKIKFKNSGLIKGIILDSPFYSWKNAIKSYLNNIFKLIPNFIINSIIETIEKKLKENLSIEINDLKTIKFSTSINKKFTYFLIGSNDEIISFKNIRKLYLSIKLYKNKKLKLIDFGKHRDKRNNDDIKDCLNYIKNEINNYFH